MNFRQPDRVNKKCRCNFGRAGAVGQQAQTECHSRAGTLEQGHRHYYERANHCVEMEGRLFTEEIVPVRAIVF